MNTRERDGRILLAYLTGTTRAALAAQFGISEQRVYQILNHAATLVGRGGGIGRYRDDPAFLLRAREVYRPRELRQYEPNTPEAFFHELLHEPRTINL